jgi:Ku70/Ku80-like protein
MRDRRARAGQRKPWPSAKASSPSAWSRSRSNCTWRHGRSASARTSSHAECQTRIRQHWYCPTCERVVQRHELLRGYPVNGSYVVLEDQELEKLEAASSRALDVVAFVDVEKPSASLSSRSGNRRRRRSQPPNRRKRSVRPSQRDAPREDAGAAWRDGAVSAMGVRARAGRLSHRGCWLERGPNGCHPPMRASDTAAGGPTPARLR